MKHVYIPVMLDGKRVGSAYIDANRLLVSISDASLKDLLWGDHLLTNVSIDIPGKGQLTIEPINESEGNTNG